MRIFESVLAAATNQCIAEPKKVEHAR
jgi:hypothetical protein